MPHLERNDLWSLESYHQQRPAFRARVMEHKRHRKLAIGPNATLYFEDQLTIKYQIQEMLRSERIFEADGIQEELDAYNPLIPDGDNFKATFMIEFTDAGERRAALAGMVGIENKVWIGVGDAGRVYAVADEDLERSTEEKTSAVHFLRFPLSAAMVEQAIAGAPLSAGIDHPNYTYAIEPLAAATADSLRADLTAPA